MGGVPNTSLFRMYSATLTNGQSRTFTTPGNFFMYYSGDGALDVVLNLSNKFLSLVPGVSLKFSKQQMFDDVTITNTSGATQTVQVVIGFGEMVDIRSLVTVNQTPSDTVSTTADVTVASTATLISGADSSRREIIIAVDIGASNGIRVGDSGVTATDGLYVGIGQSVSLNTSAAVYGIRDGASDATVSVLKLQRVG